MAIASFDVPFVPTMLRGLSTLGTAEDLQPDLALELGLSAWMRFSGTDLEGARSEMLTIRSALLEVADMDISTEPVPFTGSTERTAVLNLASYLGNLVERAAASADCEPNQIVERALASLRS